MIRSLLTIFAVVIFSAGCSGTATLAPPENKTSASKPTTGTVTIVIDDGEHVVERAIENVALGTTVEQVMKQLDDPLIKISGSGTTAFITSINGRNNSGGEGWIYRVDEEWADRGIGTYELTPPTTIKWKHGELTEMME